MDVVGIDVSKADFHACLFQGEKTSKKCFPNGASGYRQILGWLRNRRCVDTHACMEATGAYWMGLADALHKAGVAVSVVNPSRTALFARSQLRRTKTDAVDAEMLAQFCATQRPPLWTPPAPEIVELRGLLAYRDHLVAEQVRSKQVAQGVRLTGNLERLHGEQLETLAEMLDEIDQRIREIVGLHNGLQSAVNALEGVKGIGFLTAVALVAKLPVSRLRDGKAAAAYVGLSPSERQSGTSVRGKTRICKTGCASLRRDLYMPAMTAMRYNPILTAFAQRLREKSKPPKVIIAAVMRKLVVLAFYAIKKASENDPIAA